jgi:hypothetical protein
MGKNRVQLPEPILLPVRTVLKCHLTILALHHCVHAAQLRKNLWKSMVILRSGERCVARGK